MRIAVVTPYHSESMEVLKRCHDSVRGQTAADVRHVLVADGNPRELPGSWDVDHHRLPISHGDAGATPRAMGALSAFSLGYDVVMFLDADNWYYSNHAQVLEEILTESGADAAVATRNIHKPNGEFMYTDNIESNGENMIDTNTWAITRKALPYLHSWIVAPGNRLWSDRYFDHAMRASGLRIARSHAPTVAYATKWAWHYHHAGLPVPLDSVWIDKDADGNLIQVPHSARG
jgi:hypothetical protein